jgi:hypothetical protein
MAIGRVPGTDHLLALIRASLSPRRSGPGVPQEGDPPTTPVPPIRQRLAALVEKAAPRTSEDWAGLRPVLVQAILMDAFGEDIIRHPEFPSLLRTLDDALGQPSGLWEGAIAGLAKKARNSP